jgi:hypothetical protein
MSESYLEKTDELPYDLVFGYVYFKQIKDPKNPRGYSQKSLVLLSPLPFIDLFKNIVDFLGRAYFEDVDQQISLDFLAV